MVRRQGEHGLRARIRIGDRAEQGSDLKHEAVMSFANFTLDGKIDPSHERRQRIDLFLK